MNIGVGAARTNFFDAMFRLKTIRHHPYKVSLAFWATPIVALACILRSFVSH